MCSLLHTLNNHKPKSDLPFTECCSAQLLICMLQLHSPGLRISTSGMRWLVLPTLYHPWLYSGYFGRISVCLLCRPSWALDLSGNLTGKDDKTSLKYTSLQITEHNTPREIWQKFPGLHCTTNKFKIKLCCEKILTCEVRTLGIKRVQ